MSILGVLVAGLLTVLLWYEVSCESLRPYESMSSLLTFAFQQPVI